MSMSMSISMSISNYILHAPISPTNLTTIRSPPNNRYHHQHQVFFFFNNTKMKKTKKMKMMMMMMINACSCSCNSQFRLIELDRNCNNISSNRIIISRRCRKKRRTTMSNLHPLLASSLSDSESDSSSSSSQLMREAQEAIAEFLQQFKVSREEALFISSNCPKYLQMLVDGVRDLDDLSLWNQAQEQQLQFNSNLPNAAATESSTSSEECVAFNFNFKDKVLHLAKQKGDNGKFAFLESLGLTLSSAMNVARYISSQPLPILIHKVKYMKDMLFSASDDERPIGKLARDMMRHLSIPVDNDLQLTLSIFQKIEAKRGGLNMLGSRDSSFRYLVESFPRLLLLSVESHIKPMVEFLEEIGVPQQRMSNVLLLFPPIMFCNIKVIKTRVLAFQKVGAVGEDVGKMLSKYPWILSTSIQQNCDEILDFFEMEKVPRVRVDSAIRSWPHLLGCSTGRLDLMMEQFDELGVSKQKLGPVISKSPQLLLRKPEEFLQVVSFFEDVGFDGETVGKLLSRCPEVFCSNTERTLKKKLQFLTDIGVPEDRFPQVIKKYPEFLVGDVDRTLLPRVKYLSKVGLSKQDIASMICRFSPLLGYSIEGVLRPKLEFLVYTMKRQVKEVVYYPRYFSYSMEKIQLRFWMLRGGKFSLADMLGKNDEEFAADHMEVGTMVAPPSSLN